MTRPSDTRELLRPLEDFTALHAATTRRFGPRVLDLSFPNPRVLGDPRPHLALAETAARVTPLDLRSSPFGGFTPVRRRIAAALSRRHRTPYTWRDIVMTPGAAAALAVTLDTLFTPPDRIVIPTPCWMDHPLYPAHQGLSRDLVRTTVDKRLDLAAIAAAWTPRTRALIISQPASPTGIVHRDDELAALAALLHHLTPPVGPPPVLVADEAHREQLWADVPCPAPAAHYPHTVTVHSFGKAWQMQGMRTGYLALSPHFTAHPDTARRLEHGMRLTGHCAPTALTQHLAAALSDTRPDLRALAAAQHHARRELTAQGVKILDAQATRFLYARCPTDDDTAFVRRLADRGVLAFPSTLFHERGWFRLALNLDHADLARAARIIGHEAGHA